MSVTGAHPYPTTTAAKTRLIQFLRRIYLASGTTALRILILAKWARWMLMQRLGIAPHTFSPAVGFYRYTREYAKKAATDYIELEPRREFALREPRVNRVRIDWRLKHFGGGPNPPAFIARIPEGRVCGQAGDVITPDGRLLADIALYDADVAFRTMRYHPIWSASGMPPPRLVHGRFGLLATVHAQTNYFHWLFQVLPRLELLRKGGLVLTSFDGFIINTVRSKFQTETLELLDIPSEKWIEADDSTHLQAQELWVCSNLIVSAHKSKWAHDFLKQAFLPPTDMTSDLPSRLYISRADVSYRNILNEAELMDALSPLGFESVTLSGLSVLRQAALFHAADIVVAPHGAGLANLVFSRPGARAVELFSPTRIRPSYWLICRTAGIEYDYIMGQTDSPEDSADYTVNILELLDLLRGVGIS